jgi:hypothetical protein
MKQGMRSKVRQEPGRPLRLRGPEVAALEESSELLTEDAAAFVVGAGHSSLKKKVPGT